ncbi:hypothetical protein OIE66_23620 [Nonomuraea sp. NBC_01738]|uniref:hypothetical protein n=1 Tax=Nonomuraea sp. NBC_01738 TaxID=2976003 RepID=UPI002E10E773|nr:hypothetical protein OIE66_23620 [Nonomuraea sp. NBC_01738]
MRHIWRKIAGVSDGKHLSSTAIARTAGAVDHHLTQPLTSYQGNLRRQTDLPPGAFGAVGDLILGRAYTEIQLTVEKLLSDARAVTLGWQRDLEYARRNWRTAEDLAEAEADAIGRLT